MVFVYLTIKLKYENAAWRYMVYKNDIETSSSTDVFKRKHIYLCRKAPISYVFATLAHQFTVNSFQPQRDYFQIGTCRLATAIYVNNASRGAVFVHNACMSLVGNWKSKQVEEKHV